MSDFEAGYLAGFWTMGAVVVATVLLRGWLRRRAHRKELESYFSRVLKRE